MASGKQPSNWLRSEDRSEQTRSDRRVRFEDEESPGHARKKRFDTCPPLGEWRRASSQAIGSDLRTEANRLDRIDEFGLRMRNPLGMPERSGLILVPR